MKHPLTSMRNAHAAVLAATMLMSAGAHAGIVDGIRDFFGGSTTTTPTPNLGGSTGAIPADKLIRFDSAATDADAKALCDDLGGQLAKAQADAVASRAPKESVSQVINDQYGVNDLLGTKVNFGSLLSGDFSNFFGSTMDQLTKSFLSRAVQQGQSYFRNSVNSVLAGAGSASRFDGGFTSSVSSNIAQQANNVAGSVGTTIVNGANGRVQPSQAAPAAAKSCIGPNGANLCDTLR